MVGDLEDPKVHAHPLQACVRHRVVYRPGLDRDDVRSMTSSKMSEPVSDVEQMPRVGLGGHPNPAIEGHLKSGQR